MKKHVKTTKDPDGPKTMNVRKPASKPWMREYMINEGEDLNQWGYKGKTYNTWYEEIWSKYMSVEHALQQMNKDTRNFPDKPDWRIKGKQFRLVNKNTDEYVYLEFTGKELVAKSNT